MNLPYSPFETNFPHLSAHHLAVLRNVGEGWYIEYKRQVPSASNIAKSLSAFANHHGGWLFYGIEGSVTGASAFPGIPVDTIDQALACIRDAARSSLQPTPYFEPRALAGPDGVLGLASNRAVIVLRVPAGPSPPYIHSSGKIYRRVADSSDPRPETDRLVLDQMYDRSKRWAKSLRRLIDSDRKLSKAERHTPYLRLLLAPPYHQLGLGPAVIEFDQFVAVMSRQDGGMPSFPYDNMFSSSEGWLARQVGSNDHSMRVLTWEYRLDGMSDVTLPLRLGDVSDWPHYKHASDFVKHCGASTADRIVDCNILLTFIAACLQQHLALWAEARF